ncbi:glucosidase [Mycolicibacterium neoaurum]|uniref:MGH1-like glycoside hydrolase domain-containing protein n=1 Tax=Mycolicibacterium neoaurum TaxID=1795 RepID=UPI0026741923|nr:glucosidase [Mycolicibacterium neoaurum]MDO3401070.1 glucosidase [Mycolicibacterium neoaurum]
MSNAEQTRLDEDKAGQRCWRRWGTYLSERAWGTVREDYSADGDAWSYFPFDHARSRTYRWSEDGLAGWCDDEQTICLGIALWNERDAILKERPYGLANEEGNHGEDVKDYWFYTDNLPTHAYASMVYKYPQAAFPYQDLLSTNQLRGSDDGEYELFDALREQWLQDRYFDVEVTYAKDGPEDVYCRITATNRGPDAAPIHVLPQLWYRNTWSWNPSQQRPRITANGQDGAHTAHPTLGQRWLSIAVSDGSKPRMLFCENETNNASLFGSDNASRTTKDGINDHVVDGHTDRTDPLGGSKVAAHTKAIVQPGDTFTVTVRFASTPAARPFDRADEVLAARKSEADDFYRNLAAADLSADERLVQRQALAGLLWCKQFYNYAVRRWLKGDPGQPIPPAQRWAGRNTDWQHFAVSDVILMPDAWEYPWFAAWDLAFHCVTMALIDPEFAKAQILVLQSATTQHPHGQLPAYEWKFGDTNPPLHAWAAWQVYQLDKQRTGTADWTFLADAYRSSSLNAMWWLNQKDANNRGIFGGGFLGMDNIGVFDRDQPLPTGGQLAQVDGTAWMTALTFHLLEMAIELSQHDPSYTYMVARWVWDAWLVANALEKGTYQVGFWNDDTDFYHDVIEMPDGTNQSLEVFAVQAVVPLFASVVIHTSSTAETQVLRSCLRDLARVYEHTTDDVNLEIRNGDGTHLMLAVVDQDRLTAILRRLLDPEQFLSPNGIRSLSRRHRESPYTYRVGGAAYTVDYQPAESTSRMFGGNSNWRGPVWIPVNFLLVQALDSYARYLGNTYRVPDPEAPETTVSLNVVADRLARRITGLLVRDTAGRRAVFGDNDYFQDDPHWRDLVPFYEYFDGDTGRGLGGSHQTGWTAAVALLLQFRGRLRFG